MKKKSLLSTIAVICSFVLVITWLSGCKTKVATETTVVPATTTANTTAGLLVPKEALAKDRKWLSMPDIEGLKVSGDFGFIPPTLENDFHSNYGSTIKSIIENAGGKLLEFDPKFDAVQQGKGIDGFIAAGVKGVFLSAVDKEAMRPYIEKLAAEGIPVITIFEGYTENSDDFVAILDTAHYVDGQSVGEAVIKYLGTSGNICILDYPVMAATVRRIEGVVDKLREKAPDIKILAQEKWGGTQAASPTIAEQQTDVFIQEFGEEINGIVAVADPAAMGVLASIEKNNMTDKIKVFSFDGSPEAIDAMKNGRSLYCSAPLYPSLMGEWAAKLMISYLNGVKPPAKVIFTINGNITRDDALAGVTLKDTIKEPSAFEVPFDEYLEYKK